MLSRPLPVSQNTKPNESLAVRVGSSGSSLSLLSGSFVAMQPKDSGDCGNPCFCPLDPFRKELRES